MASLAPDLDDAFADNVSLARRELLEDAEHQLLLAHGRGVFDLQFFGKVAPSGHFSLGTDAIIRDSGLSDPIDLNALQHQVQHLPAEVMLFLLGSRYCETDRLSDEAWQLFGNTPLGWPRVQAICDFVHNHLTFGYEHSRATRTAFEAYQERRGVCRDYAHLAVAFCRCLNIPARYCTGYITDIGLPPALRADGFFRMD